MDGDLARPLRRQGLEPGSRTRTGRRARSSQRCPRDLEDVADARAAQPSWSVRRWAGRRHGRAARLAGLRPPHAAATSSRKLTTRGTGRSAPALVAAQIHVRSRALRARPFATTQSPPSRVKRSSATSSRGSPLVGVIGWKRPPRTPRSPRRCRPDRPRRRASGIGCAGRSARRRDRLEASTWRRTAIVDRSDPERAGRVLGEERQRVAGRAVDSQAPSAAGCARRRITAP